MVLLPYMVLLQSLIKGCFSTFPDKSLDKNIADVVINGAVQIQDEICLHFAMNERMNIQIKWSKVVKLTVGL